MMDTELRGYLLGFPGVVAEVETRVYPGGLLPQSDAGQISGSLPAVTIHDVSMRDEYEMSGRANHMQIRYQMDAWATTLAAANRIASVVDTCINGRSFVVGGYEIGLVVRQNRASIYDTEVKLWRVSQDYMIHAHCGGS